MNFYLKIYISLIVFSIPLSESCAEKRPENSNELSLMQLNFCSYQMNNSKVYLIDLGPVSKFLQSKVSSFLQYYLQSILYLNLQRPPYNLARELRLWLADSVWILPRLIHRKFCKSVAQIVYNQYKLKILANEIQLPSMLEHLLQFPHQEKLKL